LASAPTPTNPIPINNIVPGSGTADVPANNVAAGVEFEDGVEPKTITPAPIAPADAPVVNEPPETNELFDDEDVLEGDVPKPKVLPADWLVVPEVKPPPLVNPPVLAAA